MLREAGGKVRENVPLWAMGLERPVLRTDRRAIELVALGLPLYHGLPLACDATLASPLHANGEARPRAAEHPGEALARREDDKLERYPELAASARTRLMVLAKKVALRCVALRCAALHCVALCCIALRCVALLCFALRCVAVRNGTERDGTVR